MKLDAEEWRKLRRELVEAAAKYDEYETFIERNERSEDRYCNNGRYSLVGLIRWPYGTYRKCWILAPDSGSDVEPFSVMKTLFNKAWLWLPRDVADGVVDTAELHLSEPPSPPVGTELFWAKSDYQYWCWILWFHWLRQHRAANPSEAEKPSQKMILAPFHLSADLIAQWGLDGGEGTLPEWLAPNLHLDADSKPQVVAQVDPVVVAPQYSLDRINRTLEWFGERFESIERNPFQVIEILYDAFDKGSQWVTLDKLRSSCPDVFALQRGLAEVFIVRVIKGRGRNKKRVNTKHPVYEFIEKRGGAGAASYRLRPMDEIPV